jgi:hypothetical protein
VIGRFLSVDPDPVKTDTAWNFNRYNYANNNPYRFIDPDGRWVEDLFLGVPSLALGATAFVGNVATGNVSGALLDAAGMIADTVAIATPGVPGGAGFAIAAGRATDAALTARRSADLAADAGRAAPDFIVTPSGTAIPVPSGAIGPTPTVNSSGSTVGFEFTGGSGGAGMNAKVDGVRIMEANQHQGSRAVYMNQSRQTVDPSTGRTVPNADPRAHHSLEDPR